MIVEVGKVNEKLIVQVEKLKSNSEAGKILTE